MKFKVKSDTLLLLVKKIIKISSNNNLNENYKNIKVDVTDKKVYFYFLNEKTAVKTFLQSEDDVLEIYEKGIVLINIKILFDILNKLKNEWILFENKINSLIISNFEENNNFIFKLNIPEIENFPEINFEKSNNYVLLPEKIIEDINNQIHFIIDINNSTSILRGMNFVFNNNQLLITATDRICMAQKKVQTNNKMYGHKEINIPILFLNDIQKITNDLNHQYTFYLNNEQSILIEVDNFLFKGRLLEGEYPKIQNVLENFLKTNDNSIIVINDLRMFLNTIDLAVILTKKDMIPFIELVFDQKNKKIEINCLSNNNHFGEFNEHFNNFSIIRFNNNDEDNSTKFSVVFNYHILIYALKSFNKCKKIIFNISSQKKHSIITSEEDPTLSHLILPMSRT